MAKKCSHCKRSYPDHLPVCPYCEPGRAKPPTEDELVIDDIEIVAESGKHPAPPKLPAEAEPIEVVSAEAHEVVEAEEVFDADVVEVAATDSGTPPSDSSKVKLGEPIEIVDVPSDVLVVDQVDAFGSSKVKFDQPVDVTGGSSDVLVVGEGQSGDSSKVKLDQPPDIVDLPSDVLVVDEAEAIGSSKIKLEKPADVVEVPSDLLVVDEAEAVAEPTAGPPAAEPPAPPPGPPEPPATGAQPTRLAARGPVPTMLAGRDVQATMLAGPAAAAELAGEAPPSPEAGAAPPTSATPPTGAEPPSKRGAPTRIAGRAPTPTMLADSDLADELPGSELGGPPAARDVPHMELDSGKIGAGSSEGADAIGDEALDVVEASDERAEPPIEVVDEVEEVSEVVEETPSARGKGAGEQGSGTDVLGDEVLVVGASEVDLGGKSERPSGVDLIAEALESGVDLGSESSKSGPRPTEARKRTAAELGSGVDLDHVLEAGAESSAVDLGAPAGAGRGKKAGEELASDVAADALLEGPSGEHVEVVEEVVEEEVVGEASEVVEEVVDEDLVVPSKKGKAAGEEEGVGEAAEVTEEVVDEDLVTPKAAVAAAEKEEERPGGKRPVKAGGGWGRLAAGVLLGILLAGGGFAAVWYFAPDLLTKIPESPGKKGYKWQAGHDRTKEATPAQLAAAELARGEYDAALEKVKDVGTPDAAAVRGDARWEKYFKQQRESKKPLNREAVAPILEDLKTGNAEPRAKDIETIIKTDNELHKKVSDLKEAELALRTSLAKVDPKLAKADPKILTNELGRLVEQAETLKGISKVLAGANLLKGKSVDPATIKNALDNLTAAQVALNATAKQLKLVQADEVPKVVAERLADLRMLQTRMNDINTKLQAAGAKAEDAKGVQELIAARDALKGQNKELNAAVGQALDELKQGNLVPKGVDPQKQLVAGARAARLKAESPLASSLGQTLSSLTGLGAGAGRLLQLGLDNLANKAELTAARIRQTLNETPEERLDSSIVLHGMRSRKNPQDVVGATRYLDWVNSKEAGASAETRAKALLVLGLAQRNNGQFAEATKTLQKAVAAAAGFKGSPAWVATAQQTLKELTDPTAYYLPMARGLIQEGRLKEALQEVDTGLKAMPNDARLHALRGLVRLDMAQASGKVDPQTQQLVRQDAAIAQKDANHAAEGYYVLGRLEEQLGHLSKAEQNYQEALKTHQGNPEEASRYRSALARVLLRERPAGAEEEPAPKGGKAAETSRLRVEPQPAPGEEQAAATDPRLALLALVMTGVQAPGGDEEEDPAQSTRLKKAAELAADLIKSTNPKTKGEGYMILGQVYAKQGKRGEGILVYVKGLELYYPGKESAELVKMVNEHPAFQQPDTAPRYQPLLADRHYGQGLEYFWQRRYPQAEKEFKKALSYYDQDARYQYYLGLSRYLQGTRAKREAARYDFGQGARLEAASRPHTYEVNASLERLQGEMRQMLDRYREKGGGSE